ncbi:uncharacterized protein EV422DRAFT_521851 [Fimicolochytrium jonesii]|uniref:uncharacterized protein n=1 Tax=Fimicolochytrium jonesii TaxID=1396493 RepID=UPI0022FE9B2B|nr:uncharacterized protein EV422DRAFT_521851 [Fimicolochytrium jonesii]KAI8823651.1 hypothetical protein EV422DRAFT_521851 [Fimicolochytrium jonesii]
MYSTYSSPYSSLGRSDVSSPSQRRRSSPRFDRPLSLFTPSSGSPAPSRRRSVVKLCLESNETHHYTDDEVIQKMVIKDLPCGAETAPDVQKYFVLSFGSFPEVGDLRVIGDDLVGCFHIDAFNICTPSKLRISVSINGWRTQHVFIATRNDIAKTSYEFRIPCGHDSAFPAEVRDAWSAQTSSPEGADPIKDFIMDFQSEHDGEKVKWAIVMSVAKINATSGASERELLTLSENARRSSYTGCSSPARRGSPSIGIRSQ